MENRLLVKAEEGAKQLSISRSTIYQMIASGEIPSVKIGKSRRIPLDALRRWVTDRTSGGESG